MELIFDMLLLKKLIFPSFDSDVVFAIKKKYELIEITTRKLTKPNSFQICHHKRYFLKWYLRCSSIHSIYDIYIQTKQKKEALLYLVLIINSNNI